jgi:hypothetical protein
MKNKASRTSTIAGGKLRDRWSIAKSGLSRLADKALRDARALDLTLSSQLFLRADEGIA